MVAFLKDDHPGACWRMLSEFSVRGVNLSRIESRRQGTASDDISSTSTVRGTSPTPASRRLSGSTASAMTWRFLGSYPRADRVSPQINPARPTPTFSEAAAADRMRTDRCDL